MGNFIDLTGMRFGKLVVIERAPSVVQPSGQIKTAWKCICDCGREHITQGYSLTRGKAQSCGFCRIKKVEVGDKFGRLTVTGEAVKINGDIFFRCLCECKTERLFRKDDLLNGKTKSCGCYLKDLNRKRIKESRESNLNQYEIRWDYAVIFDSKGGEILVDIDDVERVVNTGIWHSQNGYAITIVDNKTIHMHRLITNCPDGYVIDHINHNRYDNRKKNLRICTQVQNSYNKKKQSNNKSGTTGVYYHKKKKRWYALIGFNKKHISLGYYENKEDAIKARKEAEKKYFGEFANVEG